MYEETTKTELIVTDNDVLNNMDLEYIRNENFSVQDPYMVEILDGIFEVLSGSLLYTFGNKEYSALMGKLFVKTDDTITLARASVLEYIRVVYDLIIEAVNEELSSPDSINLKDIIGAQRYGDIIYKDDKAYGSLFKVLRFILFVKISSSK